MATCAGNACCLPAEPDQLFCHKHCYKICSTQCCGITLKGVRCRARVIDGQYCKNHLFPKHRFQPMDQIVLYRPDNHNWPYMSEVRAATPFYTKRMYQSCRYMDSYLLKLETDIKRYEGDTLFTRNKIVLRKIELIFQNYHLNYESEYWQNIITELHTYLEPHSFLKEYRELFRRRFDIKYRKENQLMYVEKMLAKTEIGECAKKIVSFM